MAASGAATPSRLVQYVVVRADLVHKLSWPPGGGVNQARPAAPAQSGAGGKSLRLQCVCVFCCVQAPDEEALSSLSENLTQAGVSHKLWIEQPENIPTCLALKPYPKETVQPLLRKFKLFK
uniref:peptidyl-tRNA hydrolase n=1 Tax=Cynoglossus semilaevis TaxID=244447 RepID=A0A3P8UQQ6_CYNSE